RRFPPASGPWCDCPSRRPRQQYRSSAEEKDTRLQYRGQLRRLCVIGRLETREVPAARRRSCGNARAFVLSGCGVGAVPVADDPVRLGTFLTVYDVELDFVAFFERFISVQLNRRVVDEYVRSVITPDESVALGVVEPLHLTFVLSHRLLPSFY